MKKRVKLFAIFILLSMIIGACSDWKFHYRRQSKINFTEKQLKKQDKV